MIRPVARSQPFPATRDSGRAENGFVLVGVIMFILALTILGLSLFSLSSFEAQFMSRSMRDTQALYDASSGVEWARVVMAHDRTLQSVQDGQAATSTRPPRVTYVMAWQGPDSTGNIDFSSGIPVRIRAAADDQRGIRRMVEMQFTPHAPDSLYSTLVDSYQWFEVPLQSGGQNRRDQTFLVGPVRVRNDVYAGDPLNDWRLAPPPGGLIDWGHQVPAPQVADFFAKHLGGATEIPVGSGTYTLTGLNPGANFFKAPPASKVSILETHSDPHISVSGTCVLLLEHGCRFNAPLTVDGAGLNPRLVIVTGRMEDKALPGNYDYNPPPFVGIWLHGGLHSPSVPVVLVSSDIIYVETSEYLQLTTTVSELSIFGAGVKLMGPVPGGTMSFSHTSAMDAVVQELADDGALPNLSTASSAAFTPIAGTWRELDPDNPS